MVEDVLCIPGAALCVVVGCTRRNIVCVGKNREGRGLFRILDLLLCVASVSQSPLL